MASPFTDSTYLHYQYGDSEKLRIRLETHSRYTEGEDDYVQVELHHIARDLACSPSTSAADRPGS